MCSDYNKLIDGDVQVGYQGIKALTGLHTLCLEILVDPWFYTSVPYSPLLRAFRGVKGLGLRQLHIHFWVKTKRYQVMGEAWCENVALRFMENERKMRAALLGLTDEEGGNNGTRGH